MTTKHSIYGTNTKFATFTVIVENIFIVEIAFADFPVGYGPKNVLIDQIFQRSVWTMFQFANSNSCILSDQFTFCTV